MKKATTKNWQIIVRYPNSKYDEVWGLPFVATTREAKKHFNSEVEWATRYRKDLAQYMMLVETKNFRSEPIHFISFHCAND